MGSMTVTRSSCFPLLPLEGGGAKRRRLASTLFWQNGINEFLQTVRFLDDHEIGLWRRRPCDYCIYSLGRCRESTCDFPLPSASCLVPYVELSPLHITPFSPLSFFLKSIISMSCRHRYGAFYCFKIQGWSKNEKMICLKLVDRMNIVYIILLWN